MQPQLPLFNAQDFASTLWAFGELTYLPNDAWLFEFFCETRVRLAHFNTVDSIQSLAALSRIHTTMHYNVEPSLLRGLLAHLQAQCGDLGPKSTAGVMHSLALLKCGKAGQPLGTRLLARAVESAGDASTPQLALFLWSIATCLQHWGDSMWLHEQAPQLQCLLTHMHGRMGGANHVDLRQLAAAFAAFHQAAAAAGAEPQPAGDTPSLAAAAVSAGSSGQVASTAKSQGAASADAIPSSGGIVVSGKRPLPPRAVAFARLTTPVGASADPTNNENDGDAPRRGPPLVITAQLLEAHDARCVELVPEFREADLRAVLGGYRTLGHQPSEALVETIQRSIAAGEATKSAAPAEGAGSSSSGGSGIQSSSNSSRSSSS